METKEEGYGLFLIEEIPFFRRREYVRK